MEIKKAAITVNGDSITMDIPFVKVDKENRLVSGFATLDNIDCQGDIVTQEASLKAFANFRGNIREMHQAIAVGTLKDYRPDMYVDKSTGVMHQGVFVSVHISKGAPNTWEKVLDGTLSGFSIGGDLKKAEPLYSEKTDTTYRKINEYELVELSLVDSPANKLANVLFIQKSDTLSEEICKTTVHWCDKDGILTVEETHQARCPACNNSMENIGFIEKEPTTEVLKGILRKHREAVSEQQPAVETHVEEVTVDQSTDIQKEDAMADEVVKEEVAEAADEDLVKAMSSIAEGFKSITEALVGLSGITEVVKSLSETVGDLKKSVENISGTVTEVVKAEVAGVKEEVSKFDDRVAAVEADTAIKKSGDVGGVTESTPRAPKSKWGGAFLGASTTEFYR